MNAITVPVARARAAASHLVRRFPLVARILELLVVVALYAGGLVAVDRLTGHAGLLMTVYAIVAMPVVLSVGLRLYRTIERRISHHRHDDLSHAG